MNIEKYRDLDLQVKLPNGIPDLLEITMYSGNMKVVIMFSGRKK